MPQDGGSNLQPRPPRVPGGGHGWLRGQAGGAEPAVSGAGARLAKEFGLPPRRVIDTLLSGRKGVSGPNAWALEELYQAEALYYDPGLGLTTVPSAVAKPPKHNASQKRGLLIDAAHGSTRITLDGKRSRPTSTGLVEHHAVAEHQLWDDTFYYLEQATFLLPMTGLKDRFSGEQIDPLIYHAWKAEKNPELVRLVEKNFSEEARRDFLEGWKDESTVGESVVSIASTASVAIITSGSNMPGPMSLWVAATRLAMFYAIEHKVRLGLLAKSNGASRYKHTLKAMKIDWDGKLFRGSVMRGGTAVVATILLLATLTGDPLESVNGVVGLASAFGTAGLAIADLKPVLAVIERNAPRLAAHGLPAVAGLLSVVGVVTGFMTLGDGWARGDMVRSFEGGLGGTGSLLSLVGWVALESSLVTAVALPHLLMVAGAVLMLAAVGVGVYRMLHDSVEVFAYAILGGTRKGRLVHTTRGPGCYDSFAPRLDGCVQLQADSARVPVGPRGSGLHEGPDRGAHNVTVFLDALLRWHDATFAGVVLLVGLLVVRVYRETLRIYGIPASGEAPAEAEGSYRVEPPRTFSPYHAAYLINPAVLPGTVALAPLFSMGVLSIDLSTRRIVHGRATPPLNPFQSRAREQAHGVHSDELVRTLSTQMRAELAEDLRGSALQAPGDAPSVPRAATGALWLACTGLCAAALGLGGVFGGGVSAILWLPPIAPTGNGVSRRMCHSQSRVRRRYVNANDSSMHGFGGRKVRTTRPRTSPGTWR